MLKQVLTRCWRLVVNRRQLLVNQCRTSWWRALMAVEIRGDPRACGLITLMLLRLLDQGDFSAFCNSPQKLMAILFILAPRPQNAGEDGGHRGSALQW